MWTLRLTWPDRPNDWVVIYGDIHGAWKVARIYREPAPRGNVDHWAWGTWTHPAQEGYCETYEEARAAIKRAVVMVDGVPAFPASQREHYRA